MPFGAFALQWTAPSPNPPTPSKLPSGLSRSYISTSNGPLELLSALPSCPSPSKPPLFFAHGGFGCASLWHNYMSYLSIRGYACYAVSYRGHGGSWYPSFWSMYFTPREEMAGDLVAGIKEAERLEAERRNSEERIPMVVIGHSAGGGLAQYVLSRGLVTCQGLCLLAAVPGFGSYSCYTFWLPTAPLHFVYRLFHPRYLLATTQQVQDAFFTPSTPISVVTALHNLLSPYESMCWPIQALNAFVTGPDVLQRITGWTNVRRPSERPTPSTLTASGITPRLFILAAEHDVLCKPAVLLNTARQYRSAFRWCLKMGKLDCRSSSDTGCGDDENGDGVRFKVVEGVAHHLQNHVEWERGVDELWKWTEIL